MQKGQAQVLNDAGIRLEQCIQSIAGLREDETTQEGRVLFDLNLRYLKTFVLRARKQAKSEARL